jgi:hypothetical protein
MWSDFATANLTGAKLRLFTDDLELTPNLTLDDFTEPVGSWYAELDADYGEPYGVDDDGIRASVLSKQFNYSGSDDPETVRGWFVVKPGTPDVLIHYGKLESPKTMGNALDSLVIQPNVLIPALVGE